MLEDIGTPAGLVSTCTRGGGGVPATPGTMASAMLRAVGSTMCARGAMGTTSELYVASASWLKRAAVDMWGREATEAGPGQPGVD